MTQSHALRERAAQCRSLAREYHPDVARPLIEQADGLERQAARLERLGVERRRDERRWAASARPVRIFGRAQPREKVIPAQPGILFPLWEPPRI